MVRTVRAISRAMVVLALAAFAAACSDSTLAPFGHLDVAGMLIRANGQQLVRVDNNGKVTGSLSVRAGSESPYLEVVFLDSKGNPIERETGLDMEVTVGHEDIAVFNQNIPGEFGGRLEGKAVGRTFARFSILQDGRSQWGEVVEISVTK